MSYKIKAKFVGRKLKDSGKDQAPDYYAYEFTDIINEKGKNIGDKWIKETKLLKEVRFIRGKEYQIVLSEPPYSKDVIRLPYPIEIAWDKEKVYLKTKNSIIKVDAKGKEINQSSETIGQLLRKLKMEYKKNQSRKKSDDS